MKRFEKGITILLAISLAISTALMIVKIVTEQRNKQVEISVPIQEVEKLSKITNHTTEGILEILKSSGLTSLAIEEVTLKDFKDLGKVLILNGWQVLDHYRFLGVQSSMLQDIVLEKNFNPVSYYVFTRDQDIFEKLQKFMLARGYDIKTYEGEDLYILQEVKGIGGFTDIGMGFDEGSFDRAKSQDLYSIVMAKELYNKTPEEVTFLISQLTGKDISVFIPQDNKMPKDPKARGILQNFLKQNNIILGFDEFLNGNGITDSARKLGYSAIRVYNRPPHKWMEEYILAVRDRNDRLLYLHLFLSGHDDMVSYNADHIAEIRKSIMSPGLISDFTLAKVKPFGIFKYSKFLSFICSLGVIWAMAGLFKLTGLSHKLVAILTFCIFCLFALCAALNFTIFRDVAGLITAVTFPIYSIYSGIKRKEVQKSKKLKDILKQTLRNFCEAISIALIGSILLWGIFGDMTTFLGLEKFRGIKALYIISFGIMIFLYIKDKNHGISLKQPIISLGGILALVAFSGVLFVLINRTGNYSVIPIPKWELEFRVWLEKALPVRPRTKEFLMGFPALVIADGLKSFGNIKYSCWFYMAALLGVVSMVNTFSHFHIATLVSLIRSFEGILLGMLLGVVVLGGFYLYEKRRKTDA